MLFAFVDGIRQKARKGLEGTCPTCGEALVAKCGNYKIHHWSHRSGADCDSWSEGETEWHLSWKYYFGERNHEVTVIGEGTSERHRADIKTDNHLVIELQHSPISDEDIAQRNAFYGRIIWIVDGTSYGFAATDFFNGLFSQGDKSSLLDFKYFGRSKLFEKWIKVPVPVFIDFDKSNVYWLKQYDSRTREGVVQVVSKFELIEKNGGQVGREKAETPSTVTKSQAREESHR